MSTNLAPTDDDLRAIAEMVWSSYLDPDGCNPLLDLPNEESQREVSASVSVTGAWWGHVEIRCSKTAARQAAAALFGLGDAEASNDDVTDAVGELANIIGGNVKSLLPEPCALSLPHVLFDGDNRWPDVVQVCGMDGTWLGEPVTIKVLGGAVS